MEAISAKLDVPLQVRATAVDCVDHEALSTRSEGGDGSLDTINNII